MSESFVVKRIAEGDASVASAEGAILSIEVRYLHRQMFRRDPPADLVNAYLRAHFNIPELRNTDARQVRTVEIVVACSLDAVGIEPWLRGGGIRHALSAKLLLLAYLAECDSKHPEFERRSTGCASALVNIGLAIISAMFGLLRGRFQKAWHGLI